MAHLVTVAVVAGWLARPLVPVSNIAAGNGRVCAPSTRIGASQLSIDDADAPPLATIRICVNTNICGKRNPTYRPGYGFAWKALDCLRVLGPGLVAFEPMDAFNQTTQGRFQKYHRTLHAGGCAIFQAPASSDATAA